MKLRTCEYDENVIGIRVAHIDFYLDNGGYVACPFTKGEVEFTNILSNEINMVDALREQLAAALDVINGVIDDRDAARQAMEGEFGRAISLFRTSQVM